MSAEQSPARPDEYEVRADGERVRVDRWEVAIRRIVALLWGNRHAFEVDDVVEAVRALAPAPNDDDEGLVRCILSEQPAPVPPMTPAELLEAIGARDLLPLTEALCRKVEAATVARCGRVLE